MRRSCVLLLLAATPALAAPPPTGGRHGVVASTSEIANRIGATVMARGGNAVDAAVAVALALAVTWPVAGNLGGGGFMLIRRSDGRAEVIDYRERAPLQATRDMYLDEKGDVVKGASTIGYRAVAVPGTVAGLALALQRHGTKRWADLVEPARKLAAEGVPVSWPLAESIQKEAAKLARFPDSARIFLPGGAPPRVGDRLVQRDLADTLARLEKHGPDEFYRGETARRIVADMQKEGGLVSAADLAEYRPTVRAPLEGNYRGYTVLTMPPPSSGGAVLIEMLQMLEHFDLGKISFGSSDEIHLLAEVMRRAFADRAAYLGDTDFVKVPLKGLLDPRYAAERAKTIDLQHATPSTQVKAGDPLRYESPQTTHFTIVDGEGNVVTSTFTLNDAFGSRVVARGTGVLLNDEMDDFTSKPGVPNLYGLMQSEANAIAPRKRPLSAMTPTIVLKDGKVRFAIGSPGGPTIINTVLQVIVNVIDYGMNIRQAIDVPRVHHQWLPDQIFVESFGLSADTRAALERRGHKVVVAPGGYMGDAQGISIGDDGTRFGASDERHGGVPVGY